jgi:hypothetical protein
MPRRDPQAELRKALCRSPGRFVRVRAGDVVAACDLVPADDDLAAAVMRRGTAAVPPDTDVSVLADALREILARGSAPRELPPGAVEAAGG